MSEIGPILKCISCFEKDIEECVVVKERSTFNSFEPQDCSPKSPSGSYCFLNAHLALWPKFNVTVYSARTPGPSAEPVAKTATKGKSIYDEFKTRFVLAFPIGPSPDRGCKSVRHLRLSLWALTCDTR